MLAELTADQFEALDGETFIVQLIDQRIELRLIEILRKGPSERAGGSFSLLWQSENSEILPQGSYLFAHKAIGELELFIVPVGQASEGVHYEAIFA